MGATLATWLATRHPEIAGLVVINGAFAPPEPNVREALEQLVAQGVERIPGLGNDVADPSQTELAYSEVPPAQLLSLLGELDTLRDALANVHCPALVITSDQDHVVEPVSSDVFAERVAGPVERMRLVRSFHVATLDYERADVEARAVEFAGQRRGLTDRRSADRQSCTTADALEPDPVPRRLVARTLQVYDFPGVSPDTVIGLAAPLLDLVTPPFVEVHTAT